MANITILINGLEADYEEIEGLPLSLTIKADNFESISSVADSKVDNAAQRLALPATLNNQQIEEQTEGEAQPAQIIVEGAPNFSGLARLVQTERAGEKVLGYAFELFGGASSLFAELSGKSLRSLDLGSILYDLATIEASWGYTGTLHKAVFAPVYYGNLADTVTNGFTTAEVRPHPFIKPIVDKIFNSLRVSVDSTLFKTPFFARLVYMFGVGDQWSATGQAAQEFEAVTGFTNTISAGAGPLYITLPNEITDTAGLWNSNFAALGGGVWDFVVNMPSIQNGAAFLEITGYPDIPIQQQLFGQNFGPISVQTGAIARIRIDQTNPSQSTQIGSGVRLRGLRQADPGIGTDVSIASCLHEKKVTDFLAGLSHCFNLAWHYDPVLRILTVDPRFDYEIQGVRYEGFYKRIKSGVQNWNSRVDISEMTERKGARPFGNYLTLNFQEEGSYFYRLARAKGTGSNAPFLGARFDFSETGSGGQLSENPFFENLILNGSGLTNLEFMPAILPDDSNGNISEPTYESEPKLAYYAGELANWADWKWNGAVKTTRPVLYQQPKPGNAAGVDVCISYSSYQTGTGTPNEIPGLLESFYFQWLVTLERGLRVSLKMNFETNDISPAADLFRELKRFYWPGGERLFIFTGTEQFEPLKSSAAIAYFFEFINPYESDKTRVIQNTQPPTFTT